MSNDRPRPVPVQGDLGPCWFCGKGVSPRALFCHACGSVQPPADLDAFARLNLPTRFDLETTAIERQATGFRRILDPSRFEAKGQREKAMAERQRTAVGSAAAILLDPLLRARALLGLNGLEPGPAGPTLAEWEIELAIAPDAISVDRVAARISAAVGTELRQLSTAFRLGDLDKAAMLVGRLEGLERAGEAAHRRRRDVSA